MKPQGVTKDLGHSLVGGSSEPKDACGLGSPNSQCPCLVGEHWAPCAWVATVVLSGVLGKGIGFLTPWVATVSLTGVVGEERGGGRTK